MDTRVLYEYVNITMDSRVLFEYINCDHGYKNRQRISDKTEEYCINMEVLPCIQEYFDNMVILTTMVTWASASYINITIMTSQKIFGLLLNLIYIVQMYIMMNIFNLNGIKSSVALYSIYVISIIYTLKRLAVVVMIIW